MLERTAVEQQRRALDAERDGELVHQPARDADVVVLGALGRPGKLHRIVEGGCAAAEGPGDRQLQRGRGGQAGTGRQIVGEHATEPADTGAPASARDQAVPAT